MILVIMSIILLVMSPGALIASNPEISSHIIAAWPSALPALIAIVFAIMFRQVIAALVAGIWLGCILIYDLNPFVGFLRMVDTIAVEVLTDPDQVKIVIFSLVLGGMVGLVTRSGGAAGLVQFITRYTTSRMAAMSSAWLLGIIIFFDDYSNTLLVGNTLRPLTDKLKISREKLAFIVDSTAAPVTSLVLISTWIGFELGLINDSIVSLNLDTNSYWLFMQSLPYSFYSWVCLIFVLVVAMSGKDFGPMYKAEKRAVESGRIVSGSARPLMDDEMMRLANHNDVPARWYNAVVPVVILVVALGAGLYFDGLLNAESKNLELSLYNIIGSADPFRTLLWASFAGVICCFVLYLAQRILTFNQCMDAFLVGLKSLILAMVILTLARMIQNISLKLETAQFIMSIAEKKLSPGLLPAITFIVASVTSFSTGTSWGTMAILMPLVIPLATGLAGPESHLLPATIGSVLSGAVFGDHCSPISDTTIMSSMSCAADHIDHVRTQLPYAILVGTSTLLFGYLLCGFNLYNPLIGLLLSILFSCGYLLFFGKKAAGELY